MMLARASTRSPIRPKARIANPIERSAKPNPSTNTKFQSKFDIFQQPVRQKEEALDEDAIAWLNSVHGFDTHFHRGADKNARFDAAGMLDGRPYFIEVKTKVLPATTEEIESKISEALNVHAILMNDEKELSVALRKLWSPDTVPVIAVLAEAYTENGRKRLTEMLETRARDWGFDWVLWRWTGDAIETVIADISRIGSRWNPETDIPQIPSPSSRIRRNKPTLAAVVELARERGLKECFDALIDAAKTAGFTLKPTAGGVTFYFGGSSWFALSIDRSSVETGIEFRYSQDCSQEVEHRSVEVLGRGNFNWLNARTRDCATLKAIIYAVGAHAQTTART